MEVMKTSSFPRGTVWQFLPSCCKCSSRSHFEASGMPTRIVHGHFLKGEQSSLWEDALVIHSRLRRHLRRFRACKQLAVRFEREHKSQGMRLGAPRQAKPARQFLKERPRCCSNGSGIRSGWIT
jgi:hypothetical protein